MVTSPVHQPQLGIGLTSRAGTHLRDLHLPIPHVSGTGEPRRGNAPPARFLASRSGRDLIS
jgi:hypothetical protein